jgi:cytochrome P450
LIKKIIQEKRAKMILEEEEGNTHLRGPTTPRDLIDVLLNNGSDELTDELISDNLIDFMIPAEDSVPVLITLAVKFLSECPRALQQLEVRIYMWISSVIFFLKKRKSDPDIGSLKYAAGGKPGAEEAKIGQG